MRILALPLLAALAACTPNDPAAPPAAAQGSEAAPAAAAPDPGRNGRQGAWQRAESERKKLPIAWEYRSDLDPARRAAFKQLLIVSLLTGGSRVGQSPARLEAYDAVERELAAALAGKGELVAVLDYNLQYDWYFYTNDADVAAIETIAGKSAEKDISVKVENDADGEFYTTLKERLSATE